MGARELIVLLVLCVAWGFHYVVIKTAVGEIPPIFYAAMRMSLVALALAPFLRWRAGQMRRIFAAALCFGAVNYALMFTGLKFATASASAIANELYVPFATILSVLLLKERIGWRRIVGIALAFAGVAVIALSRPEEASGARIGIGVGLVAAATLIEAFGAILVKKTTGFKPWELLAWFGLIGAPCLMAITAFVERDQMAAFAATNRTLIAGAVLYSAFIASIFGHTTYYWLIQRRPVSEVASSTLLTTLLAVLFSILLLGEPLTAAIAIGGAMTLAGVGIVLLRAPATAPEPGAPESIVVAPQRTLEAENEKA
jgi:O-acetylserine/cysteine efflux transporter